jgi:hypothetical protein
MVNPSGAIPHPITPTRKSPIMPKSSASAAAAETDASTSARSITIQGVLMNITDIYAEGHVITAAEANALNQTRAEGLRNNFAKEVKAVTDKLGEDEDLGEDAIADLQAKLDDYASKYVFSASGGRVTDPFQKELRSIAVVILDEKLAKAGIKKVDYQAAGKYDGKLGEFMALPAVIDMAKARLAERKSMADSISF